MQSLIFTPPSYDKGYVQLDRIFPLIDSKLESLFMNVLNQKMTNNEFNFLDTDTTVIGIHDHLTRNLFAEFKTLFQQHIESSKLNSITNLSQAHRIDICLGCTQYIDSIYMQGPVQVVKQEYHYHERLTPDIIYKTLDTLEPNIPLIISQPNWAGSTHPQMLEILNRCLELNIPVHIDGAWITACKNIKLDFSHPAIESVAISMSKGYGLSGWNRIGLRWTKNPTVDAITIMNDFLQIPAQNVAVGIYFLNNVPVDHLWNTHSDSYNKICKEFGYVPTDTIHTALEGQYVRGLAPVIRYLESVNV